MNLILIVWLSFYVGLFIDLDLPTIVFIGDQSTGKSSVLEALSNVQLPRSDGNVL